MFGLFGAFIPAFYAKVSRQKVGRSIGFLAVFVLIISVVLSVKYTAVLLKALDSARTWADQSFVPLTSEFPALEIKDGLLVQPRESYFKEFQNDYWLAIEPDSQKAEQFVAEHGSVILLTEHRLIVKTTKSPGMTEQKTYELSQVKHMRAVPNPSGISFTWEQAAVEVTAAVIKQWIATVSAFVFPAVLVFVFGVYSFTKPLQALFFSLIALIINAAYKATFRYAQLFNISVYAMVPSTCAAVLAEYFGIRLGFFWFLYSAFYVLFLVLGIQAAKETAPQPQPPQG